MAAVTVLSYEYKETSFCVKIYTQTKTGSK